MHKTKKKTPILDQPDVLHRRGYILGKHQISEKHSCQRLQVLRIGQW